MFGPLSFKEAAKPQKYALLAPCPVCNDVFNLNICLDIFVAHLLEVHNLVIEDVQNIPKLSKYLTYWHDRFTSSNYTTIIPFINVNSSKYHLLSSLTKEDCTLREKLALEHALERHEFERTDETFEKECLFCKHHHKGLRCEYLEHLSQQHNLQLGNPQNLVFVDELLEHLQKQLDALKCIYCEKTFTDRAVLKEHMRKKLHKRINGANKAYDKYYIVNYVGDTSGVDCFAAGQEDGNADADYEDWTEAENSSFNCLFCKHAEEEVNSICKHMTEEHAFNFAAVTMDLDFYQRIKLVNYLRKQMHLNKCPVCSNDCCFESNEQLLHHMESQGCFRLPSKDLFDQPEFYFPTYENDTFLYFIEDIDDDDDEDGARDDASDGTDKDPLQVREKHQRT